MANIALDEGMVSSDNVARVLQQALDAGEGLLRLTPTWVPRSFLHPGRRIKLHPDDLYAFGANRGGIDERWFASTTEAANEGRVWHEGLSFCLFEGKKFLLKDGIDFWLQYEFIPFPVQYKPLWARPKLITLTE